MRIGDLTIQANVLSLSSSMNQQPVLPKKLPSPQDIRCHAFGNAEIQHKHQLNVKYLIYQQAEQGDGIILTH